MVSNISVSIIRTAPSDEDASILIGTIFVIDAILPSISGSQRRRRRRGFGGGDGGVVVPWERRAAIISLRGEIITFLYSDLHSKYYVRTWE